MIDRKIDSFITTNNGINTHTYTGNELGKKAFVAKTSNVVSGTYPVIDGSFYDKGLDGTGQHNDNWTTNSNLTITRESDGTRIAFTGSASSGSINPKISNSVNLYGDMCVEFDNILAPSLSYLIIRGTTDRVFGLSTENVTANSHVKLEIVGNTATIYVDGVQQGQPRSVSRFSGGYIKISFQLNNSASDMKYKNFVIYPI